MVKDSFGIKSTARDTRLTAIISGTVKELEDEQGLVLDSANPCHLLFITDYSAWRFEHPTEPMPRHLQFRLHNLAIHNGQVVV
jgi:hypothetical protein